MLLNFFLIKYERALLSFDRCQFAARNGPTPEKTPGYKKGTKRDKRGKFYLDLIQNRG